MKILEYYRDKIKLPLTKNNLKNKQKSIKKKLESKKEENARCITQMKNLNIEQNNGSTTS
jgi:hypothetical protein